jgi:hypothetical protein
MSAVGGKADINRTGGCVLCVPKTSNNRGNVRSWHKADNQHRTPGLSAIGVTADIAILLAEHAEHGEHSGYNGYGQQARSRD